MGKPALMEIVRRAYEIWEQHGKPDGRDEEFYHQAERELLRASTRVSEYEGPLDEMPSE
jgi:hypothetical protein